MVLRLGGSQMSRGWKQARADITTGNEAGR